MVAYACRISEENLGAIASEHPKFDLEELRTWLEQHKEGYFVRDENSPLDCRYFESTVFGYMYHFVDHDEGALFRRIIRR